MARAVIFPHQPIEKEVNKWFSKHKSLRQSKAGWESSKALVIASSIVNYGVRRHTSQYKIHKAVGYAWEDYSVALRGHGDNIITGPLLHMWTHIPNHADRISLGKAFNRALTAVQKQCHLVGYKHRYDLTCRSGPVITEDTDFTLPVAIPTSGGPLFRWAKDQGYDIELVREYLLDKISESEVRIERDNKAVAAKSTDLPPPDEHDNLIVFNPSRVK